MKKIPTIFVRDMSKQPALVTAEWRPDCLWVRDGEGTATIKLDGTCCMVRDGKLYKRREVKPGQPEPADFERADFDEETGKTVGWVPVGTGDPDSRYHIEAFLRSHDLPDGTYELMGPKVQGNKSQYGEHVLERHGTYVLDYVPRDFGSLRDWLQTQNIEGVVWHHPDGRAAKIKRRDFGLRW